MQQISDAVRPVFFQTEFEEFRYATHGGTLFVVNFYGRFYGVTCRHVFQDFTYETLFIAPEKNAQKGSKPAPIKRFHFPSTPRDSAIGTDIVDMCAIEFADDIPNDFFKGSAYIVDTKTVITSEAGHILDVFGVLKDKTSILPPNVVIGYGKLEFVDVGAMSADPILRQAVSELANPEITSVVGISGSPVFNRTANALCGMVVRAGMIGRRCSLHYIDALHIVRFLEAVSAEQASTYYRVRLRRPPNEADA